ncbi:MAG: helix-turn-helix domain-containing protein [Candidatus Cyclobacteriaceae bacterium M2_1C_046]
MEIADVSNNLDIFKIKLGKRIKFLREQEKLTQLQLAARINVDYQSISRIENGHVNPSAYFLKQLAEALRVDMNSIFDF